MDHKVNRGSTARIRTGNEAVSDPVMLPVGDGNDQLRLIVTFSSLPLAISGKI
jgi:hypothetical protein